MTLYVSIRRAILVSNKKLGRNDGPFEIRKSPDDKNPESVVTAEFKGTVRLVYNKSNPLASGALCWLEIDEESGTG